MIEFLLYMSLAHRDSRMSYCQFRFTKGPFKVEMGVRLWLSIDPNIFRTQNPGPLFRISGLRIEDLGFRI